MSDDVGDDVTELDPNNAEVRALINAAVTSVKAEYEKHNEILQEKLKTVNDQLSAFGGQDPDTIKKLLERIDNDEEAKLIAEGKYSDLVSKKTAQVEESWKKRAAGKDQKITELAKQTEDLQAKLSDLTLGHIVSSAWGAIPDANPQAYDAVLTMAKQAMRMNGDSLEIPGGPMTGTDGSIEPEAIAKNWLEETFRLKYPFFFKHKQGIGAAGNNGHGSFKPDFSTMSRTEKSKLMADLRSKHGGDQMAAAAEYQELQKS